MCPARAVDEVVMLVRGTCRDLDPVDQCRRPRALPLPKPVPSSVPRRAGPVRLGAKAWLEPGWPVRTPVGRPLHVLRLRLASAVAYERPSVPTVDRAGRPSPFHSHCPLTPQPPSVGSGMLSPSDPARAAVVPGWAGPNVGPGWLVPWPTSGSQFLPSLGPAPQASTTFRPH